MAIPNGSFVQALDDPVVYYIQNGQRCGVPTQQILDCLGGATKIIQIDQGARDVLPNGPIKNDCNQVIDPAATQLGWPRSYYAAIDETSVTGNGSQHLETRVWLGPDGVIQGFYQYKNDTLEGWCGGVAIAVYDAAATAIQVFTPPSGCINGKGFDTNFHERRRKVQWSDNVRSDLLARVRGIGLRPYETQGADHLQAAVDQLKAAGAAVLAAK